MCHEGSELSLQGSAESRHLFRDVYDYSFRDVHVHSFRDVHIYSFRDVRVYHIIGFSREQAFVQGCPDLFVYGCQCSLNYRVQQTADTCLWMSMFIRLGPCPCLSVQGCPCLFVQGCPCLFVYGCLCLLSLQGSAQNRHLFRDVHIFLFMNVRVYYIIGFSREQTFVQGCPRFI